MKIIFVRHGESEANLLNEFSNCGLKHGLTKRGKAQAVALAQQLGALSVARIFSSPLLRAVQTAEILSAALSVPYETVDALREYACGILEGRSDAASWAQYRRVLEDWIIHHRWESRIEGGESFVEIRDRFVPFIEHLVKAYVDSAETLVLVGHGGLYRCMLPLVLENLDFGFAMQHPLSNTGYVEAEVSSAKAVCVEWSCGKGEAR
ncbi:MAG: histidine phosphatase family protein [Anaerolineae bacterium]|jgi:broad specificity phosphatase PhoE